MKSLTPSSAKSFLFLACASLFTTITPASATLLLYDGFGDGYTAGSAAGVAYQGTGFTAGGSWNNNAFVDIGLTHPALATTPGVHVSRTTGDMTGEPDLSPAGPFGAAGLIGSNGNIGGAEVEGTLYYSFLGRDQNGSGSGWAGFNLYNGADEGFGLFNAGGPDDFAIYHGDNGEPLIGTPSTPIDGDTHFFVVRVDYVANGKDTMTAWLNPDPTLSEAAQDPTITATQGSRDEDSNAGFNQFRMRGADNEGWDIDEIRFGTTWEDVTPIKDTIAVIAERSGIDFFELDVADVGTSVLDPATINLLLDGVDVTGTLTVTKDGTITTIRHDQMPQYSFGAVIPYEFEAADESGAMIGQSGQFTVQDADVQVSASANLLEIIVTDVGASVIQPGTIALSVDGNDVTATLDINKVGDVTTIRHHQDPQFPFDTAIPYEFDAMDNFGQDLGADGSFTIPAPLFPFGENLIGAEDNATDGNWGVRYLWGTGGLLESDAAALAVIQQAADDPDNFIGTIVDVSQPVMNNSDDLARGLPSLQPNDPYHPDAINAALPAEDFVLYGVACMQITEAGTYTIGVQSDDGFGLRVHGWTFTESFGGDVRDPLNGTIDGGSSDTILHPTVTGNSMTRAIAENVQPGVYRIEFFWWERGGGDYGQIYIAQGRFPNDADTADWLPIGSTEPGGIQLVGKSQPFRITEILYNPDDAEFTITWTSRSDSTYRMNWGTDLTDFAEEIDDSILSGGESTTHTFPNPSPGEPRLFFKVYEN